MIPENNSIKRAIFTCDMENPETRLAQRLNSEDGKAFREVYDLYNRMLFVYLERFAIDGEDAKEIISDAFVKLSKEVRQGKSFDDDKHIKGFLFKVARNAAINLVKRLQRQAVYKEALMDTLLEQQRTTDNDQVDAGMIQTIYSAAEKLPEKYRAIFIMHYMEELGFREIAIKLGLPVKTVYKRKSRAITLLKEYIFQAPGMAVTGLYTAGMITLLTLAGHCLFLF
jgi:RNA polymerase sigma-70 factor (ECF subfamily)